MQFNYEGSILLHHFLEESPCALEWLIEWLCQSLTTQKLRRFPTNTFLLQTWFISGPPLNTKAVYHFNVAVEISSPEARARLKLLRNEGG